MHHGVMETGLLQKPAKCVRGVFGLLELPEAEGPKEYGRQIRLSPRA